MRTMNIQEFNIPMPWGHIAVKAWGDPLDKPVLVLHGRMDNAGSFDRLIPLLPKSFYYICIDLPSHGQSSHFPPFVPIYFTNFVLVCKLVVDYFKREKYVLLGHSYGGGVASYFARLYPEYVEKFIGIDIFTPLVQPKVYKTFLKTIFDGCIDIYQKQTTGNRPAYTEDEALEKVRTGRAGRVLPVDAAVPLVRRMLEPDGSGKYYFSTDQRMKFPMHPVHDYKYFIETSRLYPIMCPCLYILCRESSGNWPWINETIEEVKKLRKAKVQWVEAGHDVHMSDPEVVAPIIVDFLMEWEAKL